MSPKPMIGQHDNRAFYHRRRWERSERSETTSASRTVSNTRTYAIGDAVMIASGVYSVQAITRKSFRDMTRKLSVTQSHRLAQFRGTLSRKKSSVASAN